MSIEQQLDDQKFIAWLERAAGVSRDDDEPFNLYVADRCARCGSTELENSEGTGDVVCIVCGVVRSKRSVSCDNGNAVAQHRREATLLDERDAKRARNSENDKRSYGQSYQRQYHFNERIAARQNLEPRVPLEDLRRIERVVRYVLGVDDSTQLDPRLLSSELIQGACKALDDRCFTSCGRKIGVYAERWLQIRYYLITGRTERLAEEPHGSRWDIKWMSDREVMAARRLFKKLSQSFDELYYKPSARHTTKDNYTSASAHAYARHNMLQLDFVIRYITLALFGEARYEELRTEFCFPLNRSEKAMSRLATMMTEIVEHADKKI
jgi:uncharacterized Zn finger protein (UPF0148 family)